MSGGRVRPTCQVLLNFTEKRTALITPALPRLPSTPDNFPLVLQQHFTDLRCIQDLRVSNTGVSS